MRKNFPLNTLYWSQNDDETLEVLDGQQRIISICNYVDGRFSVDEKYFHSLTEIEQNQILDYRLMVYFCEGTEREKLDWFQIINIAGEVLTPQELRNAVYTGSWLSDAKRYFSKSNCPAVNLADKYIEWKSIRQEILELVLNWISDKKIEEYMSKHQHDADATELWNYFTNVIEWIEKVFPEYRKEMKGLDWGFWYNEYKNQDFNGEENEKRVVELMKDAEVENKKWIYQYILTGKEKYLNLRQFSDADKATMYARCEWKCTKGDRCENRGKKNFFGIEEMEADHITPWHEGGKTILENCQMLCRDCNRRKSGK